MRMALVVFVLLSLTTQSVLALDLKSKIGNRLPPRDCIDCGGDPTDKPAPKPPAPSTNSPPQFAMQFKPPFGVCLVADALNAIVANIKQQIPTADVHSACLGGGIQNIGIWRTQPTTLDPSSARDVGTSKVSLLQGNETFAMTITSKGYLDSVDAVWSSFPKAYDSSGNPNSGGPVFLTDHAVTLFPLSQIILTIDGKASGVTFHLTSVDTLSISGGKVTCSNSADLTIDKTFLDVLLGFAFIFAPVFTPPLVDLEFLAASYSSVGNSYLPGEAKCSLGAVIPNAIPLSPYLPGQKADFTYKRLTVTPAGGIQVGGSFAIVQRTPSFEIHRNPSATIRVDADTPATAAFTIEPTDVVPPLTVSWSAPGATKSSGSITFSPKVLTPTVTLSWANISMGISSKSVTFTLRDVDNKQATASTSVPMSRTVSGGPPVCDGPKASTLPQCQ